MRGIVNSDGYKWSHYLRTSVTINNVVYTYDGKDHELYDLNVDPTEQNNLLSRLKLADGSDDPNDNPLLRGATSPDQRLREAVLKVRRQLAVKQTNLKDPAGIAVGDTSISQDKINKRAIISWISASPSSTEVMYRTCASCPEIWKTDLNLVTSHSMTLEGLSSGTSYNLMLYNMGGSGNGGFKNLSFLFE